MAGNQGQFSTNLGLPVLPTITDADPRLYNEFILIYNALRSLAVQLDRATGLEFRDEVAQAQYKVDGANNTYIVGNMSKLYLIAGEALTFGQFVSIASDGKVYKAKGYNITIGSGARKCHGMCTSESVAADDVVEVSTTGVLTSSGLVAGRTYCLFNNANIAYIDGNAHLFGYVKQVIGVALSDTQFLVAPSPDWYVWTEVDVGLGIGHWIRSDIDIQ